MIRLELELGDGHRVQIGMYDSINKALKGTSAYLKKIKFTSYYNRYSIVPNDETGNSEIWIDFGSHTQFFYISGFSPEELSEWIKPNNV